MTGDSVTYTPPPFHWALQLPSFGDLGWRMSYLLVPHQVQGKAEFRNPFIPKPMVVPDVNRHHEFKIVVNMLCQIGLLMVSSSQFLDYSLLLANGTE